MKTQRVTDEPDDLLTAAEVAKMLRLKTVTVYRQAQLKNIPCITVLKGKRRDTIRFRRSAIEKYIRSRETR